MLALALMVLAYLCLNGGLQGVQKAEQDLSHSEIVKTTSETSMKSVNFVLQEVSLVFFGAIYSFLGGAVQGLHLHAMSFENLWGLFAFGFLIFLFVGFK